jgi:hypothetical protein
MLCLDDEDRKLKIRQIKSFLDIYEEKMLPIFSSIEQEADKIARKHYDDLMSTPSDGSSDGSEFADAAIDVGLEYYQTMKLIGYNTLAAWISVMYQFWEQQIRSFLYQELKRYITQSVTKFCENGLIDAIEWLRFFNVDLKSFPSWQGINEMSLLVNVIKHGDGRSAKALNKIKPDLFKKDEWFVEEELLKITGTSLLEEVINIDSETLKYYGQSLIRFWEDLPETMYSQNINKSEA